MIVNHLRLGVKYILHTNLTICTQGIGSCVDTVLTLVGKSLIEQPKSSILELSVHEGIYIYDF